MAFALFGSNANPNLANLDANFSAVAICVDNFTQLRSLPKIGSTPYCNALGGTTRGDGAGGIYWLDTTDTTSADNGSTIIVATDGGRWKFLSYMAAVTTQPITNNGTAPASTAFVRAAGGGFAGITSRTAAATLTVSDANKLQVWAGTTAATLTLPAASAIPAGMLIEFVGTGSTMAALTVSRAGTDTISDGDANLTSLVFAQPGFGFALVSNGSNGWTYVGPRRRYESAWTATLPAASTATSFTHSLGVIPRLAGMVMECTTADASYAVGDRVTGVLQVNSTNAYLLPLNPVVTGTTLIVPRTPNGIYVIPKTGGGEAIVTLASWRYRVWAEV